MLRDDLSALSAAEIDALPFGYIGVSPDGTIRKYNRYEADLARKDPQQVLGRNFFREVAPCTQVREFEGRFRELVDGAAAGPTLTFDFEFRFRHGTQKVRIGFVRSPLQSEVIVTVNRLRTFRRAMRSASRGRKRLTSTISFPCNVSVTSFLPRASARSVSSAARSAGMPRR